MDNTYELALQDSLNKLDYLYKQSESKMKAWGNFDSQAVEKSPSSLDAWDYCFSIAIGIAGITITTSEQLEHYLTDIHDAASGATGDYSLLQKLLGALFHHQGDAIDKPVGAKFLVDRNYDAAYVMFHRLLWGHDILDFGSDNPFKLMFEQKGILGILQAARHLIADTMSKQGLPMPGSSFFDYTNENGKISNYLIDISQNLSESSVGNKLNRQPIYSHMFTIRAQDIMGGGAIAGLDAMYFKVRGIDDPVRKAQFRLISYAVAFFGEAIRGAMKQNGVPYINVPLASLVFKNLVQLYYFSIKETRQLHDRTYELIETGNELVELVYKTGDGLIPYDSAESYFLELSQGQDNVDSLISFFEGGTS